MCKLDQFVVFEKAELEETVWYRGWVYNVGSNAAC